MSSSAPATSAAAAVTNAAGTASLPAAIPKLRAIRMDWSYLGLWETGSSPRSDSDTSSSESNSSASSGSGTAAAQPPERGPAVQKKRRLVKVSDIPPPPSSSSAAALTLAPAGQQQQQKQQQNNKKKSSKTCRCFYCKQTIPRTDPFIVCGKCGAFTACRTCWDGPLIAGGAGKRDHTQARMAKYDRDWHELRQQQLVELQADKENRRELRVWRLLEEHSFDDEHAAFDNKYTTDRRDCYCLTTYEELQEARAFRDKEKEAGEERERKRKRQLSTPACLLEARVEDI